jgi:protein involved in polysaccharide export with SLBB domain
MSAKEAVAVLAILALCASCRSVPTHEPLAPPPTAGPANMISFTNQLDPALLEAPTNFFTLGPGDRVEIELLGEAGSKATTSVAPDGKLYYDLLPGIDVWGLTLAQTKARIQQEYSKYLRQAPQVSLVLREVASKRIWILGRVQAPGIYSMTGPMTLLEAISLAGGTLSMTSYRDQEAAGISQELADLPRSFVVRNGRFLPVDFVRLLTDGDLSQNIYLQPDDFIYLPTAASRDVYVLGAVTQPRPVPYEPGMTVAGAVAGAYGTLKDAYISHVAVVRGSLSRPQVSIVDLKLALLGQTNDVALLPGDIVYVPLSPYRYISHYIEVILDTFVSSVAINEGTRIVGVPSTGTAGVFIPVGSGIQVIPPSSPPAIH